MLKKLLSIALSSILLFFYSTSTQAADEFYIDSIVEYRVEETGKTQVKHTISLENAFSALYAKQYQLVLEGIDIVNPQVVANGKPLKFDLGHAENKTSFEIFFDEPVVGKGKVQSFEILYDNFSFAQKTGDVWEISIPKIGDERAFRDYTTKLIVPAAIGPEAYVSPKPINKEEAGGSRVYTFNKEKVTGTGVTAGFGEFQVFSFSLNYHLENPLNKSTKSEIALPPDTAFQRLHYQTLNPEPESVHVDTDGNWIAVYMLSPRQKIDVTAQGAVQIFSGPVHFPRLNGDYLNETLKETEFWQTSDPSIKSLATRLGTVKNIYDYVYQNLTYDYDRVKPNVVRLGAKGALEAPGSAICMEYTDLFVALARAAGIPAREINGFAYTENPQIQPLSLVSDVLHSWPEYWDEQRGIWVPVDPTWASTTGGVDYFSKLDLRHFTFVIHGSSAEKPYPAGSYKLGANPQKDIFVSFGELPPDKEGGAEIDADTSPSFFGLNSKVKVTVKNTGSTALYSLMPIVSFDSEIHQTENIETLPPYGRYQFEVNIPFSFLGRNTPDSILVTAGDAQVSIPSFKRTVIIYNLLFLFVFAGAVIILVLIKLKKIDLASIKTKIYDKFHFKSSSLPKH